MKCRLSISAAYVHIQSCAFSLHLSSRYQMMADMLFCPSLKAVSLSTSSGTVTCFSSQMASQVCSPLNNSQLKGTKKCSHSSVFCFYNYSQRIMQIIAQECLFLRVDLINQQLSILLGFVQGCLILFSQMTQKFWPLLVLLLLHQTLIHRKSGQRLWRTDFQEMTVDDKSLRFTA